MADFLARPLTLWVLLVITLAISLTLSLMSTPLDYVADPEAVSALIANMSEQQKQTHIWTTLTLDTAYPLTYGAFFVGMALKYFGQWWKWISLPGLTAALADFAENAVQVLALSGIEDLLWMKVLLTPGKFYLALLAGFIALVGLVISRYNRRI